MKRLVIISFSILFLTSIATGRDDNSLHLIEQLSEYIGNYYRCLNENKSPPSQEKVLRDIKDLLKQSSFSNEEYSGNSIDDLELNINRTLKANNYKIVLFVIPNSQIVNCWLGEPIEETTKTQDILDKSIDFNIVILDNLKIHDYLYFSTQGREMLEVGTKNNSIYYNLEALRKKAEGIYSFFQVRGEESHVRRYDPSKFNRLRKYLQRKAWEGLYMQEARKDFIAQAVAKLKENSFLHELAHIYIKDKATFSLDDAKEEEFAFLFELSYGSMPFESLDAIVGVYAKGLKSIYYEAANRILEGLVDYIQKQQARGVSEYKGISVRGTLLKDRLQNIYRLSEKQIQEIAVKFLDNFKNSFLQLK